jgi:hypothetical protein
VNRALQGDEELIRFFQKAVGSTLAGDISEQVFFFLHGPSKTAKSTLLNSGQGADLLETRVWDALSDRVASYSASRSFRTAAI